MIDPKELRIGNLVYVQSRKLIEDISKVEAIDKVVLQNTRKMLPIPLTPEWLERLGYHRGGEKDTRQYYSWRHKSGWCVLDQMSDGVTDDDYLWIFQHPMGCLRMKYVHQIMNLFFALTGEELKIKEK